LNGFVQHFACSFSFLIHEKLNQIFEGVEIHNENSADEAFKSFFLFETLSAGS